MITVKRVEKYPQCQMCMGTENVFEVRADGRSMSLTLCDECATNIAGLICDEMCVECQECGALTDKGNCINGTCLICAYSLASDAI